MSAILTEVPPQARHGEGEGERCARAARQGRHERHPRQADAALRATGHRKCYRALAQPDPSEREQT